MNVVAVDRNRYRPQLHKVNTTYLVLVHINTQYDSPLYLIYQTVQFIDDRFVFF